MTDDPFPEARWSQDSSSLFLKLYYRLAGTAFGTWFVRNIEPLDDWLLRKSGGRLSFFGSGAMPVLVLETIGRKSGRSRESALTYMRDANRLFVLGSNFGQANHPGWSANLLADPNAFVTIAGKRIPVTAALLTGDEEKCALKPFLRLPVYRRYCSCTDRKLRMFALTAR